MKLVVMVVFAVLVLLSACLPRDLRPQDARTAVCNDDTKVAVIEACLYGVEQIPEEQALEFNRACDQVIETQARLCNGAFDRLSGAEEFKNAVQK